MKIFENIVENFRKPECRWPMAILILFTFFFGYLIRGCGDVSNKVRDRQAVGEEANAAEIEIWTCSMHPQIRQSRPGKCPICGMDLIPVSESNEKMPGYRELQLSERAAKIADIETAPVEHRYVINLLSRLSGRYPRHNVCSVFHHLTGMKASLAAGYSLYYHLCVFID